MPHHLFPVYAKEGLLPLPDCEVYYYPEFLNAAECQFFFERLLAEITWQQAQIRMFGKMLPIPRLQAFYGDSDRTYTYSNLQLSPQTWTDDLLAIREKIEQKVQTTFTSVLLNLYRDEHDSMGWHADDEPELGQNPVIASLSLGQTRKFQLKHKTQAHKAQIWLENGSLLLMKGQTQHFWLHQLPKANRPMQPRINLTFRVIG